MAYKPIKDYGVIGDMHSAALVGLDGSTDWLCFPRFDAPSVFAAILDDNAGGRFRLSPKGRWTSGQTYLPDTNVLATTFTTPTGKVEVIDFMPVGPDVARSPDDLFRLVRCLEGRVEMECLYEPRLDYARGPTTLEAHPGGVVASKDSDALALASDVPLSLDGERAHASFALDQGQEACFVLCWDERTVRPVAEHDVKANLSSTVDFWRKVAGDVHYEGRWGDWVSRSVLALHLLVYEPSGAICAAATTSLPEAIGGPRNWDYRYSWLRDAAFTLDIFHRLGHVRETTGFINWLTNFCDARGVKTQTLYGLNYETDLREFELTHLEGYRGSRPVRIGNAAAGQLQMDIFGEVLLACATYYRSGGSISDAMWDMILSFADAVIHNWQRPDRGIWEVRGETRHFVYSKVMCWVALDRAITLAEALGKTEDLALWRRVRQEIHDDVLANGWSDHKQAFVQHYGADDMDASNLLIPLVGFLPADDPRVHSTVNRIREELCHNDFVHRYRWESTDDGLEGEEGAFTMCTLWLVGALIYQGRLEEAQKLFEKVLACANHVGLFSEMVEPRTGEALGNFPQAFTHVSLIHTARNLDIALSNLKEPVAPKPLEHQVGVVGAA
jgi:GH15 family glucan-1,4-alpha-glucosidase